MSFLKFFRGGGTHSAEAQNQAERISRRSNGLGELSRQLAREGGCSILDLGPTSAANITYFTNLGTRTYTEDILRASREPQYLTTTAEGQEVVDPDKFLAENLNFEAEQFDAVLCWDVSDYLSESLVKPVVARLHKVVKPGGLLLAFFHTKDAGADAPYHRYHIVDRDTLQLQRMPVSNDPNFKLQRVFNNRHIENLFREFGSIKFFLGRDNIREVLVVR